jgi:diadenosine tetraphosphate (Ap4A) HIT family hydrolase
MCDFCNEFSGRRNNSFNSIYGNDPTNRLLFRSADFVVFPTLGQIVEGYLLLVPTEHHTSLADLPVSLFQTFARLSESVTAALAAEYGPCLLFEHGTRSVDAGGCGISHAHLHAVPFPTNLDPIDSLRKQFSGKQLRDLGEIAQCSKGLPGYLFYQDSLSRAFLFDVGNLPSQYMRRIMAEALGLENWDWRAVGREERLVATLNRLSIHFDSACVPTES